MEVTTQCDGTRGRTAGFFLPLYGPRDGSYLPRYLRAKKVKELAKVYGLWGKTDSDFQRASK